MFNIVDSFRTQRSMRDVFEQSTVETTILTDSLILYFQLTKHRTVLNPSTRLSSVDLAFEDRFRTSAHGLVLTRFIQMHTTRV